MGFDCWELDFYQEGCVLTALLSAPAVREVFQLVLNPQVVQLHFIAVAGLSVGLQILSKERFQKN